jgi:hypothetical protein
LIVSPTYLSCRSLVSSPQPIFHPEPEGGLSAIEKIMEEQKRHDAERAKIAADAAAKRKEAEGAHEDIGVKL